MNRFACVGFAGAAVVLAMGAVFTPQHVTDSHSAAALPQPPTVAHELIAPPVALPRDAEAVIPDDSGAVLDLYGNDVSPALATYSFDALGGLYEVHSPQTELPRLGSPKT